MTSFVIKIIACITMVLDHIKYAIPCTNGILTEYFGRMSFPLFAFLITEGYVHTKDLKKYCFRLLVFGFISQIPYMFFRSLVGEWRLLNIMFTMALGLMAILVYDKIEKKYISIPIVIFVAYLGDILRVDYGSYGVLTVFIIYLLKNKKIILPIVYGMFVWFYYYSILEEWIFKFPYILYPICTWLSSMIMVLYNGKKGRKTKYFFYLFYPIHMIIVYLISLI